MFMPVVPTYYLRRISSKVRLVVAPHRTIAAGRVEDRKWRRRGVICNAMLLFGGIFGALRHSLAPALSLFRLSWNTAAAANGRWVQHYDNKNETFSVKRVLIRRPFLYS